MLKAFNGAKTYDWGGLIKNLGKVLTIFKAFLLYFITWGFAVQTSKTITNMQIKITEIENRDINHSLVTTIKDK